MIWHPSDFDLALVNAGDLPAWKRYLVERHLRRCDACSEQAQGYGEVSRELRRLGQGIPETPEWLAARIVAGPTHASRHTLGVPRHAFGIPRHAFGIPRSLAPAAALLALICLAVLLIEQRTPLPPRLNYQASVSAEAIVGELSGPQGRQRVVLYTGMRRGPVEVSAGAGVLGISYADPDTGALTITRVSLEGAR